MCLAGLGFNLTFVEPHLGDWPIPVMYQGKSNLTEKTNRQQM